MSEIIEKNNEKDFFLGISHSIDWEQDPINKFVDLNSIIGENNV